MRRRELASRGGNVGLWLTAAASRRRSRLTRLRGFLRTLAGRAGYTDTLPRPPLRRAHVGVSFIRGRRLAKRVRVESPLPPLPNALSIGEKRPIAAAVFPGAHFSLA